MRREAQKSSPTTTAPPTATETRIRAKEPAGLSPLGVLELLQLLATKLLGKTGAAVLGPEQNKGAIAGHRPFTHLIVVLRLSPVQLTVTMFDVKPSGPPTCTTAQGEEPVGREKGGHVPWTTSESQTPRCTSDHIACCFQPDEPQDSRDKLAAAVDTELDWKMRTQPTVAAWLRCSPMEMVPAVHPGPCGALVAAGFAKQS